MTVVNAGEYELIWQAQQGDERAFEALIRSYEGQLRSVVREIATAYNVWHMHPSLVRDAVTGIWRALGRFQLRPGVPPWAFFRYQAREELLQIVRQELGLSEELRRHRGKVHRARAELYQELEREPSPEEISRASGLKLAQVQRILVAQGGEASLEELLADSVVGEESSYTPLAHGRIVGPEEACLEREQQLERAQGLPSLWEDILGRTAETLATEAPRWLILYLLTTAHELTWEEIAAGLTSPTPERRERWVAFHETSLRTPLLSANWDEICLMFNPPKPTDINLRAWFARRTKKLAGAWPEPLPRLG